MNKFPRINHSSLPSPHGNVAVSGPGSAPALPSSGTNSSPSAGTTLGKRKHTTLTAFEKQCAATQSTPEKGPEEIIKSAIEQWMTENYKSACVSLVDQICQKISGPIDEQQMARSKKTVEDLVGKWVSRVDHLPNINQSDLGQRQLILTRMLAKIIRHEDVTYDQACRELDTLSSLPGNQVGHLYERAQAYCRDLKEADPTLPEMPTEAYGLMALIALHDELEKNGYALADLVGIVSNGGNARSLLVLASNILSLPPFTSGDRDNRSEAHDASSIARNMKIARHSSCVSTIFAIREHLPALLELGFSLHEVLGLATYRSAAKTIKTLRKNYGPLKDKGLSHKEIVRIASRNHAAARISDLLDNRLRPSTKDKYEKFVASLNDQLGQEKWSGEDRKALFAYGRESHDELRETKPFPLAGLGADKEQVASDLRELIEHNIL